MSDKNIEKLEKRIQKLEEKLDKIQQIVENIEKDIYLYEELDMEAQEDDEYAGCSGHCSTCSGCDDEAEEK